MRSDNTAIIAQDYATYDGMRVGVLRNSSRNDDFEQLAKEKGFSYTVTYYPSADEMAQALRQEKVDAVVSSSLRRTKENVFWKNLTPATFMQWCEKETQNFWMKSIMQSTR